MKSGMGVRDESMLYGALGGERREFEHLCSPCAAGAGLCSATAGSPWPSSCAVNGAVGENS